VYIPEVDIIVPVWNRPVETRTSLVNLSAHSPGARLILINNGSDRETESLLEEFADFLDERALLISTPVNLGFIKAVNVGLARSEAEFVLVVRSSTMVSAGWLDPLLELVRSRPETGIVSPIYLPTGRIRTGDTRTVPSIEIDRGDFSAMLVRREMYSRIGGFDGEMDGGAWCLKDYSRRALKAGYTTCASSDGKVAVVEEAVFGSVARREELREKSSALHARRWGAEQTFCVLIPRDVPPDGLGEQFNLLLRGARQGHQFTVLVLSKTFREIARKGFDLLHSNIRLEKLSRFFAARRAEGVIRNLCAGGAPPTMVDREGEGITMVELKRLIDTTAREYYEFHADDKAEGQWT
jgi:Glycosyl transferase family 2